MNCLAQRKKFKNKHPVWTDDGTPAADEIVDIETYEEPSQESQHDDDLSHSTSSDDDDEELYANDVRSKKISLDSKNLMYKHLVNLNNDRSFKGAVQQVQFHPLAKMALVAVGHGEVDLFEVDGERNRYIQNIKIPKTRKPYCSFRPDGNAIVISSEDYRGSFYTYDMVSSAIKRFTLKVGRDSREMTDFTIYKDHMACRKEGSQEVVVLSSKTYENTFSVKINEPAKAILFTENEMFVAGENSRVYIWDLRKTTLCKHRFQDEGSVHTSSICMTEASKMLSIGSDCGIVNSYELENCYTSKFPRPVRTFNNLKTSADIIKYNPTGELLLMASKQEPKAFRLIHTHSGTVYRNFPVPNKEYGHLLSAEFSPLSGYLALGCSRGRAHLCRLPFYKSY